MFLQGKELFRTLSVNHCTITLIPVNEVGKGIWTSVIRLVTGRFTNLKTKSSLPLEQRVLSSAEAVLANHHVSPIEVLVTMRLLEPVHVEGWRKGRYDTLESTIQANPDKVARSLAIFRQWAESKGLQSMETEYSRPSREGAVPLQFTVSGDPDMERIYRTHYVSPALSDKKKTQLKEKLSKADKPVVFDILRDSECSECGTELPKASLLFMDAGQPLCLACARMGDLEYLGSGDTALTRRATKYSSRVAVVVRFSRSRGRYEREGILAEPAAIEKAEQECLADADVRARSRALGAERRKEEDRRLTELMTARIRELFPGCPPKEAAEIAGHTAVAAAAGSAALWEAARWRRRRLLPPSGHRHTNYDRLLLEGSEREYARSRVQGDVEDMLEKWRG